MARFAEPPEFGSSPDASSDPDFMARWYENILKLPSEEDYPPNPSIGQIAHVGAEWRYWDGYSWILMIELPD